MSSTSTARLTGLDNTVLNEERAERAALWVFTKFSSSPDSNGIRPYNSHPTIMPTAGKTTPTSKGVQSKFPADWLISVAMVALLKFRNTCELNTDSTKSGIN